MIQSAKRASRWIALAAGVAAASIGGSALAASAPPTIIEYLPGQLLVQDNGVNFYAQLAPPDACKAFAQTIDTIKVWESLAQSALLAGKKVNVFSGICGGLNYITGIDLVQ
jgi:hypothetical protein